MPITTRSQFKLRKRSPPPEVVSQPPKRKSKRVAKEEPDEQFQAELEKVYVGEKRGAKTLREKIGYDEPEEDDDDDESSEEEDGEDSAEDEEEAVDDGGADDVVSESSDAENAGDDSDDAVSEDEADDVVSEVSDAENPGIDVNDSDGAESESSGDFLMVSGAEEEADEPKIQELNEEFFDELESSVQFLRKGPKQKAANIERLGECITRLDTQFVCFLRSREILTPSEEKKCQDDVKLRLLKNYKELLELLPVLVNDEKVELIVRQRTAIALNNFAKEERPGRALQAAVKAYLSSNERHCPYIEDLGSALQDDHRRAGVAAREALQVVEEVTANGQQATDIFVTNLLSLLSSLTPPEIKEVKYKSGSFEAVVNKIYTQIISGVHAKKGAETEYGVKPLPLNDYNARRLLIRLPTKVFPLLKTPTMAADLLDRYFARGGIFTFLALEGIFTLMTKHNLEFPHFYQKLYASLNASILTSGYRSVYFRMMDRFFSSTHLPDYLVRAFVKKLSRLALGAPADAAFGLIPMILNFVIRYPSLKSLVTADCAIDKPEDPFDVNEPDPSKCKAQNSCLWELKCLTQHAVPDVAEMAVKTLKQPMPTMESDVSKRIDTNMEYVFRSVSNKVVPPDVALAIRPDVDFLKLGFV